MAGKLYLCATPIGNLEDITYRVVRTLNEVDLIGAEDTRNSIKLLNHFDIKTPMTSYHEFNKYDKAKQLVEMMKEGKNIAIITDAGTPGISDPGEEVVRQCFEAFLPKDKKEKVAVLEELKNETRTIIIYEAPHRLARTLKELRETLGNRQLTLCRELTKKYEEADKTTIDQAIEKYNEKEPRGEYVLVIEGKSQEEIQEENKQKWESMTIEEHMEYYISQGNDKKSAMKLVAKDRGVSKRDIYNQLIK